MIGRLQFFVHGLPKAQGRGRAFTIRGGPKAGQIRVRDPETSRDWKADVKAQSLNHRPPMLLDGPLRVWLHFTLLRPKSLKKTVLQHTTRPDCDNLGKAIADALKGIIYRDDALIVDKRVTKRYGEPPGVMVTIEELSQADVPA